MASIPDRAIIPPGVIAVVAEELGASFTHTKLDTIFRIAGASGDPPLGNKVDKCAAWLTWTNKMPTEPPLDVLGVLLGEYMDADVVQADDRRVAGRQRITSALAKNGLAYARGRVVAAGVVAGPTRSLDAVLRQRDLPSVEKEFTRALENVATDPEAAVTAACAVIESFCRIYIEDHGLVMPAKQDLGGLWKEVRKDLKLDGADVADDDIKKVLGGLASIADGVAALRTHAGSAHGKGRRPFPLAPRHARLAVHAAHTLVVYLIERADDAKK